jgi:transcription elongation factor GreA
MMSQKTVYLTPEGRKRLKEELEYLRTVRRPQVAAYIQMAKDGGDIMENAGYDDAKNEQAFLEGRIATLETMLKNAALIEEPGPSEMVTLGSWVKVAEDDGQEATYRIVGWAEVDPINGLISNESPLGQALLGHRVGEEVTVKTPDGVRRFKVSEIR